VDKGAVAADLEKLIHAHNIRYFIDNNPVISDEEFDRLTEELRKLKPDSPVLFELVGEIGDTTHPAPMLSLDKKYTHEEIIKWIKDVGGSEFYVEPKYDGMASRYQNGTLSTRGNGYIGEDISRRLKNLKIIGELPKDKSISVYGEVIIPLTYFNEHLAKEYKNP
jgi:DNA ligase (NAD+)